MRFYSFPPETFSNSCYAKHVSSPIERKTSCLLRKASSIWKSTVCGTELISAATVIYKLNVSSFTPTTTLFCLCYVQGIFLNFTLRTMLTFSFSLSRVRWARVIFDTPLIVLKRKPLCWLVVTKRHEYQRGSGVDGGSSVSLSVLSRLAASKSPHCCKDVLCPASRHLLPHTESAVLLGLRCSQEPVGNFKQDGATSSLITCGKKNQNLDFIYFEEQPTSCCFQSGGSWLRYETCPNNNV